MLRLRALAPCLLAATLACDASVPEELPVVVGDGKQDNFLSLSAQEFVFEGVSKVHIEAELASASKSKRDARAKELIGLKKISIAWFLTQYLIEKEADDPNKKFGGMGGIAKNGAFEDSNVNAVDATTYEFTFRQIVAAKPELIHQLKAKAGPDGRPSFSLEIGAPTNEEMAQLETNDEWYRNAPWEGWDPDKVADDKKETITFAIEEETESSDAWFDFNRLFEDGRLTMDVHFGWDYHSEYHVKHPKALFSWLVSKGFTAPVGSFEELTRTSGPFRKTIKANGRSIKVEVRLYYPKSGSSNDPDTAAGGKRLESDMRNSLATRDVVMYSGHSGPFYGFALANWRKTEEGDLDDSEMASVPMDADRYQIVFAEGCDTYQIGEAFSQNPAHPNLEGLDVITTTSASNAATPAAVKDFISRLTEVDKNGNHRPRTVVSLLTDLDNITSYFEPMYGIHGIDDNPTVHPYAELDNLCEACGSHSDCGGIGNICVDLGDGGVCATACSADTGCPNGYRCAEVASPSSLQIYGQACVPSGDVCE